MTKLSSQSSEQNNMNARNNKQYTNELNGYSGSSTTSGFDESIAEPQKVEPKLFSPQLTNQLNINSDSDASGLHLSPGFKQTSFWGRLRLRTKAMLAVIALGTIPVVGIGIIAYQFADRAIVQQITQVKEARAVALADRVNIIIRERYADILSLSNLPILINPKVRAVTTQAEKQAVLDNFLKDSQAYDSIAVADLDGNTILQSSGEPVTGLGERDYFKEVIKTKRPVITEPRASTLTGEVSIFLAAPLIDRATGEMIAVVRTRTPVTYLDEVLGTYATNGDEYYVVSPSRKIILSSENQLLGKGSNSVFDKLAQLLTAKKSGYVLDRHKLYRQEELVAYTPFKTIKGLPDLNWSAVISTHTNIAYAPQYQLLLTLTIGTAVAALLVGALSAYFANRATRPIVAAADAVEKLGHGELDIRIPVEGKDELATLGSNINQMATQLQNLLYNQAIQTEQANFLSLIASARDQKSEDIESVFNRAVEGARELLKADRVVIYRFNPDWSGYITAESVLPGWPIALNNKIEDPCISQHLIEAYRKGRVVPTNNVMNAGFHPEHQQLMERLQIKANLVTPILKDDRLFGLLIAHHCAETHEWQQGEISFLSQLAALLGIILNRLSFLEQKQVAAERASTIKDITLKLSQGIQAQGILDTAVEEIRAAINSDRVVVYSFDENWKGTVIAESVNSSFPKALGAKINDPCFAQGYVEKYRQGRVQATENIYNVGLTECHIAQLEQFAVKANLVAPIIRSGELLGLLIAHQCDAPRQWQQEDIDLFSQVATQVGLALDRALLLDQQKSAKEFLQRRALELLMEVDPISRGDLTIRANVTEDEIGTIADSYNATINSLRKIVSQVQTAAKQVSATTSSSEGAVQELSKEALRQTEEITVALEQIRQMSDSILAVGQSAAQAEVAVQQATQTVAAGDAAMNRTVDGMMAIRQTVAETSKKVKRLGESSQKISKVVNLISTFADQTNLLALNASIEAAHAGEQGRGFAVVADEVRTLARQSAEATAEIESLVKDIQTETNEVVAAMESGTEQVVTGTVLVHETRQNLLKITEVSQQISELVGAIATAATAQSRTSQMVTTTMSDVAAIASHTSEEATVVSASFKELLALAQELQTSASQFKVS